MSLAKLLKKESNTFPDYKLSLTTPHKIEDFIEHIGRIYDYRDFQVELFKQLFATGERSKNVIHPSEVSYEEEVCTRFLYYSIIDAPVNRFYVNIGEADNKLQRIFDLGTMIHWYLQVNLLEQGLLSGIEVVVKNEAYKINGHADGVTTKLFPKFQGKKLLAEIKSINTFGYRSPKLPYDYHVRQASIYAKELDCEGILFIYYDKNTSDIKYLYSDINEEWLTIFYKKAKKAVRHENHLIKKGVEKLPEGVCKTKRCKRADECRYLETCFNLR